jgi:hypothetical protein
VKTPAMLALEKIRPKPPVSPMVGMGTDPDADDSGAAEGETAAAEQMISAMHSKDPKAVVAAFKAMSGACGPDEGE